MTSNNEELVPVFMPALATILVNAEDKKGEPLDHQEVLAIRDKSSCIMMDAADAFKMEEERGYRDVDPENCWHDWQMLRRELDRKPDLDPGPRFSQVDASDPEYQQSILAARESLDRFREMLPDDGSPRADASVKTEITDGDSKAFMWLCNACISDSSFVAEFFELPDGCSDRKVGDRLEIAEEAVLDWMVNDNGILYGGFSLRYMRAKLPEDERAAYDQFIGVTEYA